MPLPSTGYATATATNPSSSLTDFTLLVDLSTMPASWWTACTSSDGTKCRAAKDDGTELPFDVIDFSTGGSTGWMRVKWSGTLSNSGTQVLRIYPSDSGNTSYGASDTYGSDSAYISTWKAYYPDGASTDRTANSYDMTPSSVTAGDVSGKVGVGTNYAGSPDYSGVSSGMGFTDWPLTIMAWIKSSDSSGSQMGVSGLYASGSTSFMKALGLESNVCTLWNLNADRNPDGTTTVTDGSWRHFAGVWTSDTLKQLFQNNSQEGGDYTTSSTWSGTADRFAVGRNNDSSPGQYFIGHLNEVQVHSVALSADWRSEEYAQSNSQASFWGSWTWNAPAGGAKGPKLIAQIGSSRRQTFSARFT